MNTESTPTLRRTSIPIFDSKGEVGAFLAYPYLYNRIGEWIGWVTSQREVYSVLGHYVGYLTDEPRILRKRVTATLKSGKKPPTIPPQITVPATVPLAPMMREITYSTVDVLLDEPERLHTMDSGEQRQDLD
jgi:hypothetical protein